MLVAVASAMWIAVVAQPVRVNAADPIGWRPVFSESFDDPGALPTACTAGDRAGLPGASTALPAEFQVDYLRIWAFEPVSSAPAVAAAPSTVDNALRPGGPAGHRWSLWLAVAAIVTAALALFAFVIHKTRPHRPPSSHRA
jgi:hypothetical protein